MTDEEMLKAIQLMRLEQGFDPTHVEIMGGPRDGERIEIVDLVDDSSCWECGESDPFKVGLWDHSIAGEPLCLTCGKHLGATFRLDHLPDGTPINY